MDWYKKSMEQSNFGFAEDDSTLMDSPKIYHSRKSRETLTDLMNETSGFLGVESNLVRFKYKWKLHTFPSGKRVITVRIDNDTYVIDDFITPGVEEATDWLWSLGITDMMSFYPDVSAGNDFWSSPIPLYHGTTEGGLAGIIANGLHPRDESRGVENRHTGAGIFMSDNPEEPSGYYPVVVRIDTSSMKADGFTPGMQQEDPIVEAELRDAVANRIGMSDFQSETESGISPTTLICREVIPAKYIRRVK